MLYSPKWEVKADPFSLESLISWLEKMSARKSYPYKACYSCLLAQYFTAMGFEDVHVSVNAFVHGSGVVVLLPPHFNDIAQNPNEPYTPGERTFGAALARARSQQHTARGS